MLRKYLPYGGARLGILAAENSQQRLALLRLGALFDDDQRLNLALVDWSWPRKYGNRLKTVKARIPVVPFNDLEGGNCLAVTMGGQRIELTRTAIGAVAVDEFPTFDRPLNVRHFRLLIQRVSMPVCATYNVGRVAGRAYRRAQRGRCVKENDRASLR